MLLDNGDELVERPAGLESALAAHDQLLSFEILAHRLNSRELRVYGHGVRGEERSVLRLMRPY